MAKKNAPQANRSKNARARSEARAAGKHAHRRQPTPLASSRRAAPRPFESDVVVITGMSGSGKASVLRAFEDLGFYCVDNLPVDLIPKFAELVHNSQDIARSALVVDIREGEALERFPAVFRELREQVPALLIFL